MMDLGGLDRAVTENPATAEGRHVHGITARTGPPRWPGMTLAKDRVLRLWPVPAVCAEARKAVRQFCDERGLGHLSDDAELMTSELVSNVVRHATTLFTVVFVERNAALVVGVVGDAGDREAASLYPAVPADTLAESGRGLFVVDQLADAWGTSAQGAGTAVWFRLS